MLTRREFLKGISAGIISAPLSALAKTGNIETTRLEVHIKQAENFTNYKIALLCDLHLGPFFPEDWFNEIHSILNSENPDLVMLGGDYINIPDNPRSKIMPERNSLFSKMSLPKMTKAIFEILTEELKKISAPDGVCGVFGNHDRWLAPQECTQSFLLNKHKFLLNQSFKIQRKKQLLNIFGADDFWTGLPAAQPEATRKSDINILLSHNPDHPAELIKTNTAHFDLALCGHTHAGQIKVPMIGALYQNIKAEKFMEGLNFESQKQVFTSRGIGMVGIPFRLNCPPEIAILTIK